MSKKIIIPKAPDLLGTMPSQNSYVGLSQDQLLQRVLQLHEQINKINSYLLQTHKLAIYDYDINDNEYIEVALPDSKRGYLLDSTIKYRGEWDPVANIPELYLRDRSKAGWAYMSVKRFDEHPDLGFIREGDFLMYDAEGVLFNFSEILNARGESYLELGETDTTAFRGDLGKTAYEHVSLMDNPHGVTPEQIGVYTREEVDDKIATAMRYKGNVPSKEDLPTVDNVIGDFYNVLDDGINYAWDGEKWDKVGGFTDVRLFEVSGSDVVETLKDGFDFTFTSDLNSMILTIPSNVTHGYFSGFNFKTKTSTIGITFVNESSMPLRLFKFSKELPSIHLNPNKTITASLHSDGFNIYCYYIEV